MCYEFTNTLIDLFIYGHIPEKNVIKKTIKVCCVNTASSFCIM